jgi:hypothetical protein
MNHQARGTDRGRNFGGLSSRQTGATGQGQRRQISISRRVARLSVLSAGLDLSSMASEDTSAREHFTTTLMWFACLGMSPQACPGPAGLGA